jgi:hypothetical protein
MAGISIMVANFVKFSIPILFKNAISEYPFQYKISIIDLLTKKENFSVKLRSVSIHRDYNMPKYLNLNILVDFDQNLLQALIDNNVIYENYQALKIEIFTLGLSTKIFENVILTAIEVKDNILIDFNFIGK